MNALIKKEINFYLNKPLGYIVVILFAIFANFLFVKDLFLTNAASLRPFFDTIPYLFMIFIPALVMRLISEEKKTNTLELLLSLPISEIAVVVAKYVGALIVTVLALSLTTLLPISMYLLTGNVGGKLHLPEIFAGYVGLVLCASSFIAVSLFYSSITKDQIVAFLLSSVTLFFLVIFSTDFASNFLPPGLQSALNYFSPVTQLMGFSKGVIDIRSVFYFFSSTIVFLTLTVVDLERRK